MEPDTGPRWESPQRRRVCVLWTRARARAGQPVVARRILRVVGGTRHAAAIGLWGWITGQPFSGSQRRTPTTRVTRRRRDGGAARPGPHLSPVRREAPPLVAPADEESVIEIPPEVLAQQRVDALEAKLDALLNGGPRYQPVEKAEPVAKKEAWGRAEGCAAVSALFDARAHEVCDLQQMQDIVGLPDIPESLPAFVQAQFQLTFRSKHICEEKLEAFCNLCRRSHSSSTFFQGRGRARPGASGAIGIVPRLINITTMF